MGRKKILFAINNLSVGGAENLVIEQINAINKDKFKPYLLTLYQNPKINLLAKVSLPSEQFFQFNFKSIFNVASWLKLYKLLRRERFDVVITNLFDANFIVRIISIFSGVKTILSYEHSVYSNKKFWQKLADHFLSYFTYKILVGSSEVKKFTSAQEKIALDKFVVNYNSAKLNLGKVNLNRNSFLEKNNLPLDALYIVTAGRLITQKGHYYLIEAAKRIIDSENQKIIFLIYGQGDLKDKLEEQIKKSNLTSNVFLKGIAPIEEILAISDIFVLPSLWEGLSVALIQAMNAACPIVATRVSGTEEVIDNEVNGLLVKAGDAAELEDALRRLIKGKPLREKFGEEAQKKSYSFSIENNIKKIEEIINNIK